MLAILRPEKTYEGFSHNKKYKMTSLYSTSGKIEFKIENDSGKLVNINERIFNEMFLSGYPETMAILYPDAK